MASSIPIEKLNSENYGSWSVQMKSLLVTLDYWAPCETPVLSAGSTAEEKANFKIKDSKALATIILSVKPSELIHIKNCSTALLAWNKLRDIYVAKTPARKVNLFKKLVRYKIKDGSSFSEQINEFSGLVDSLKENDLSVTEDFLSIVLLCSLPDSFDIFVVAMESRDKLPSLEQLKVKILEERNRRGDKHEAGEEQVLAVRRGDKRQKKYGVKYGDKYGESDRKRNIKCYACGKRGHIKSECRNSSNNSVVLCANYDAEETDDKEWIIDSGASSHICRHKEKFTSLSDHHQPIYLASGEC